MLPLYDRKQSKRETHWQRPGEFDVFTNCNVVSTCHVWYVTQYGHVVSSVIVGEDSAIFGSELPGNDDDDGEDGDDERDQEGGAVFNSSSWLPGRDSK